MDWTITIAIVLAVINLAAVVLTILGLPGVWLMIVLAAAAQLWLGDFMSWWTILVCAVIGLIGEAVEFAAGAAGSHVAGGAKRSAIGALVGGLVGAIAGAAFPPIIGAVIWGVVGAGVGAVIAELTIETAAGESRAWRQTMSIGGAAAAGRLVGTVAKTACAVVVYLIILVASFVP